jgi:hypothetical protein
METRVDALPRNVFACIADLVNLRPTSNAICGVGFPAASTRLLMQQIHFDAFN